MWTARCSKRSTVVRRHAPDSGRARHDARRTGPHDRRRRLAAGRAALQADRHSVPGLYTPVAIPAADGAVSEFAQHAGRLPVSGRSAFSRVRRSAWAGERISRFRHTDTRSCRAISRLRRAATQEPRIRRSKTSSATASICGPPRPTSGYGRGGWTSDT